MLDLQNLQKKILAVCQPRMILLFGSQAKGTAGENSDVDLCIVTPTSNKRRLLTELYYAVEYERPIDFLLYTPEEWSSSVSDSGSFAYKLSHEGVWLYGG